MSFRVSTKIFEQAYKAPWYRRFKFGLDETKFDYAKSNNFAEKAASADDSYDVEVWRVDTDNNLRIGGQAIQPMTATINFPLNTTASIATQCFFIAPTDLVITGIKCCYDVTNGIAATGKITKDKTAVVPGAGIACQVGTFNLNSTARTVQTATLPSLTSSSGDVSALTLTAGDRLSFKLASGSISALAGLVITIYATPSGKGTMAVYNMQANGDIITQTFFLANRPFTVQKVMMTWDTAATNAGAVTMDITNDTSTNAPGAGTSVLTAAQSVKGTINTPVTVTLSATAANLVMAAGDRIAVKTSGTLTALAGLVIVVWMAPTYDRKEVTFTLSKNANIATQPFFVADRDYEIIDASFVHKTAAGGALKIAITNDTGTSAAGAGLVVQTDNTNTGFDAAATANTVQVATMAALRNRFVVAGNRLSILLSSTVQATAGVTITVSLRPRS